MLSENHIFLQLLSIENIKQREKARLMSETLETKLYLKYLSQKREKVWGKEKEGMTVEKVKWVARNGENFSRWKLLVGKLPYELVLLIISVQHLRLLQSKRFRSSESFCTKSSKKQESYRYYRHLPTIQLKEEILYFDRFLIKQNHIVFLWNWSVSRHYTNLNEKW